MAISLRAALNRFALGSTSSTVTRMPVISGAGEAYMLVFELVLHLDKDVIVPDLLYRARPEIVTKGAGLSRKLVERAAGAEVEDLALLDVPR